jgi:hypothetical protein
LPGGGANRFAARFRLARSFRGISLDGYAPATSAAYAALFRLLLAWSAFELYLSLINLTQRTFQSAAFQELSTRVLNTLRTIDSQYAVFRRVLSDLSSGIHQTEVGAFVAGDACNTIYLVSAIRHVFAHGPLPAVPTGLSPGLLRATCDALAEYLLEVIDSDFTARVKGAAV